MRFNEFAPTQIPDRGDGGDNEPRMTWDEILNYFTQTLTFTLGWRLNAKGVRQAEFTKGSAVFIIDQGLSATIFRYRLHNGQKVVMSGFAHTLFSSVTALLDRVRKQSLNEFAPTPGYEDDPWGSDVPRYLHHFANIWWNAADPKIQKYIEDQMATGGWTIQQIGEEMVELRHREGTRYRISSDEFDPDLREGRVTADRNTALSLAQDLQYLIANYNEIQQAGTDSVNAKYLRKLKLKIETLHQQIRNLGYKYVANRNLIQPLGRPLA